MIEKMQMICLMCKEPMPEISLKTMEEISYTHYSYCEKCLRKGLALLRKRGEWVKDRIGMQYPYRCTKCDNHHRAMYNYCPSCGAKMEENKTE